MKEVKKCKGKTQYPKYPFGHTSKHHVGIITILSKGAQLYITWGLKGSCEMSKIIQYRRGEPSNMCLINQVFKYNLRRLV